MDAWFRENYVSIALYYIGRRNRNRAGETGRLLGDTE